jgi:hypothetical protein
MPPEAPARVRLPGAIMDEVPAPHVVDRLGFLSDDPVLAHAQTPLFHSLLHYALTVVTPQPVHPIPPDFETVADQQAMDQAIAVTRMLADQSFDRLEQRRFIGLDLPAVALRAAWLLFQRPTRAPLADADLTLHVGHRRASPRRAHSFPKWFRADLRMSRSSSASASSFLSRPRKRSPARVP